MAITLWLQGEREAEANHFLFSILKAQLRTSARGGRYKRGLLHPPAHAHAPTAALADHAARVTQAIMSLAERNEQEHLFRQRVLNSGIRPVLERSLAAAFAEDPNMTDPITLVRCSNASAH